jgi:IrrE N-terminal-like domain
MPDDEACFDSDDKLLYIRESTYCAANAMYTHTKAERRHARFTIAHEIGHLALKHDGLHFVERRAQMQRKFRHEFASTNAMQSGSPRRFSPLRIWPEGAINDS